jgi:hypothetical protein
MRTKSPARSRHLSWHEYRRFSEARTLQRRAWPAHRVLPPLSPSQELAPVFIAPWDDRELLDVCLTRSQASSEHCPLRVTYGTQ